MAMVELVQYFVLCCGCRATITMEMFQNEDTTSVIRSLTENFDEASDWVRAAADLFMPLYVCTHCLQDSGDYPLIAAGATYKKFKVTCACSQWSAGSLCMIVYCVVWVQGSFSELLEQVVEQCQHSILFDEYMLDTLIIWLVGFTDSQVRAFRHTCTLACESAQHTPLGMRESAMFVCAGLKLVTALVHVANSASTELDNTQVHLSSSVSLCPSLHRSATAHPQRQIDAEKKRQQAKKGAAGKLEKLLTKRAEVHSLPVTGSVLMCVVTCSCSAVGQSWRTP